MPALYSWEMATRAPGRGGQAGGGADPASGGGTDAYVWYSGLNKNSIPFHAGAGFWGAQSTIKEAIAPTVSTSVNVSTFAQLESAMILGSRTITLTASIDGADAQIEGDLHDCDVIIPSGLVLKNVRFGSIAGTNQCARLRFRGSTLGIYGSGGQVHHLDFCNCDDVIIEGLDMSGPGGNSFSFIIRAFNGGHSNRLAVHNIKARCGGYWYVGDSADATFVNCSVLTGEEVVSPAPAEAWGVRCGVGTNGNIVVYLCDIRSSASRGATNSYHRFRCHPNPNLDYVWVDSNQFLNNGDGRFIWSHSAAGNSGVDAGDADSMWVTNNKFHSNASGCDVSIGDMVHARFQNNTVYATNWTSDATVNFNPDPGNATAVSDGVKSGNTYNAYSAPAAWIGPGDPSGISYTP